MEALKGALLERLYLFEGGVLLALAISLIAWRWGYYTLPPAQPRGRGVSGLNCLGAFALFLSIELFITPLIALGWDWYLKGEVSAEKINLGPVEKGWLNVIAIFLVGIAIAFYLSLLRPETRMAVFGDRAFQGIRKFIKDILLGIVSWVISFPVVIAVSQIIAIIIALEFHGPHVDQVAVKNLKSSGVSPLLFAMTVICVVAIVPVIEEIIFRGFLQGWLRSRLGRGLAIPLTAIIFALFHYSTSQGVDNFELLISLFILACFLGFIYERQNSIWASAGLHATFNSISAFMIFHQ